MQKTKGVFYDGLSSSPQSLEIILDKENSSIVFNIISENLSWKLDEILVEQTGSNVEIRSSAGKQLQSIKISDPEFILQLKKIRREKRLTGFYHRLLDLGFRTHAIIAICILAAIGIGYVLLLPWIAERAVVFIPDSYDNSIGTAFFERYIDYTSIDSVKTKALKQFASQLNLNNTKEIKFTVVRSKTVNAFALPDGNIIVFTGIIELMMDYDELAALIGHEVAHVNNRHSMKMMCRNLAGYFFLSAVLSDVNGIMAVIGDNIHTLQSLTYSRNFEHEADAEGLKMLVANKINPKGMSKLFKRLQAKYVDIVPEFLSSHPITENRIKFIDKTISGTKPLIIDHPKLHTIFLQVKGD